MRALPFSIALAALASGCGAKTGLDADPLPSVDAGPPGFDTFPCRWSASRPVEVARGAVFTRIMGAMHGVREEVAVLGQRSRTRWIGSRYSLGDPPVELGPLSWGDGGQMMGWSAGWAVLNEACEHQVYDDEGGFVSTLPIDGSACVLEPAALFEVTVQRGFEVHHLRRDPEGLGPDVSSFVFAGTPTIARTVDAPPLVGLARVGRELIGHHPLRDAQVLADVSGDFDVARDHERPGVVILRLAADGSHVDRVGTESAALSLQPLAGPAELSGRPFGTVATNETEALVPLRDGRIAVLPLSGSRVRFIEAIDPEPTAMRVVLRPGTSSGGVLYVGVEGVEQVLSFRTLTCNR